MSTIKFALNRTCLPHRGLAEFLALAANAGVEAVEIRNDIEGQEFADGTPAADLRRRIEDAGLRIASVNALQRFNDCTPARLAEAQKLIDYAAVLGAPGIVMCPVIDARHGWSEVELETKLRHALKALAPMFRSAGVTGYVEPLGMLDSTLRQQAIAVDAINDVDGWASFQLCFDTFQFWRASDTKLFSQHIGLVHVSGISPAAKVPSAFVEPDRGLVFVDDQAETITQLRQLRTAGYEGYVSIEPFSPQVQTDPDLPAKLRASLDFISATA